MDELKFTTNMRPSKILKAHIKRERLKKSRYFQSYYSGMITCLFVQGFISEHSYFRLDKIISHYSEELIKKETAC